MSLLRTTFPVGALGCNCTIVACADTRQALVVDPGDEGARIVAELARLGLEAVALVHTHAHFDHVLGTAEVAAATKAEVALHPADRWLWDRVDMQAALFGLRAGATATLTRELGAGDVLAFGKREARVLHTPGHTPGSISFFVELAGERPLLFSGDTLFAGSIGRTDLWGGSSEQIVRSIRDEVFALPDETLVVPGHGPETTIGAEREDNPFVGKFARG